MEDQNMGKCEGCGEEKARPNGTHCADCAAKMEGGDKPAEGGDTPAEGDKPAEGGDTPAA